MDRIWIAMQITDIANIFLRNDLKQRYEEFNECKVEYSNEMWSVEVKKLRASE